MTGAGVFAHYRGDDVRAVTLFDAAAAGALAAGEPWLRAYALHWRAGVEKDAGRWAEQVPLHAQALALFEATGDSDNAALVRWHLGKAEFGRGDLARARVITEESLAQFGAAGDAWGGAHALYSLGLLAWRRGRPRGGGPILPRQHRPAARGRRPGQRQQRPRHRRHGGRGGRPHRGRRPCSARPPGWASTSAGTSACPTGRARGGRSGDRAALGEAAFEEAWALGRGRSFAAAFADAEDALAEVERRPTAGPVRRRLPRRRPV